MCPTSGVAIDSNGTIYLSSLDELYAINPNGTLKWTYDILSINSSPSIGLDGTIYVASQEYLTAINPDGTLKWNLTPGYKYPSSPAIASDGTIYIAGQWGEKYCSLYAINPDGTSRWTCNLTNLCQRVDAYYSSSPAIGSDGTIYVGTTDFRIYAVDPNGSIKWNYLTHHYILSSPAIALDGTIYVCSYDGGLYALNPDGSLKWRYSGSSISWSSPCVGLDGTIYVGFSYYFRAINHDGSLKWIYSADSKIDSSPAIASDGTIYFSCWRTLYAIGGEEGLHVKGRVEDGSKVAISGVTVTLSGNVSDTYITGTDGYYEFLNLTSGNYTVTPSKPGWSFDPPSYSYSPLDSDKDNQNFIGTEASALLKKYAPVLYLHEDEQFYPWGIRSMLDMAELWEEKLEENEYEKVEGMDPPIYSAKLSSDYNNKKYYLNLQEYSPLNPPPSEKWQSYKLMVYGRQYESFDHIVLQYWFLYPFNDHKNNHEGDWEMAQVVLDKATKDKDQIKLCLAWHRDGNWYSWDDVQRIEGTHPKIFVALGGHGCWATSGTHNLGGRGFFFSDDTVEDETVENAKVLYPASVSPLSIKGKKNDDKKRYELEPINNETCWVDWLGKWGELSVLPGFSGPDSPANISYDEDVPKRWDDPVGWCNALEEGGKPSFSHYIATGLSTLLDVALHAYLLDIGPYAYDETKPHVGETETGKIEATIPGTYFYVPSYYSDDRKEWMWIDTSENLRFEIRARSSTESLRVKGGSEEISNLSFNTHQVETTGKFNFALNRYIKEKDEDVTVTYSNVKFTKDTIATVDVSPENPGYLMKIDLDGDGIIDEIREPDVIEGISTLDSVIVYPNPCYLNKGRKVKITPLPAGSKIYIYTIAGELVRTLEEDLGIATWDCRNEVGEIVARGIYIYLITSNTDKKIGKIAIIK